MVLLKFKDFQNVLKNTLREGLSSNQLEIFNLCLDNERVTVKSCHASGKTFVLARIIIYFLLSQPYSRVVATASVWGQIGNILFPEIRKLMSELLKDNAVLWFYDDILVLKTKIEIEPTWYAIGVSHKDPGKIQGHHADNIMVVVDEAAEVPSDIFSAIEGIISSGTVKRLVLTGNPRHLIGEFYKSFDDNTIYKTMTISCFDTPNFKHHNIKSLKDLAKMSIEQTKKLELPNPYLISPQWVRERLDIWGEDSNEFNSRCIAEFPKQDEDSLINRQLVEEAINKELPHISDVKLVGVDVGYLGDDLSVVCIQQGGRVLQMLTYKHKTAYELVRSLEELSVANRVAVFNIDVIGHGAAVRDGLKKALSNKPITVNGINNASSSHSERYANKRAVIFWSLREMFVAGNISIPNDPQLIEELISIKYFTNDAGKTQIEKKDKLKLRIGRSPDRLDALSLAMYEQQSATFMVYRDGVRQ